MTQHFRIFSDKNNTWEGHKENVDNQRLSQSHLVLTSRFSHDG